MSISERLGGAMHFARANHQLLTTRAMLDAGLTYDQVSQLCRDDVLERIVQGLYRIPGTRTPVQDAAAVLLRRPLGVLSHSTALYLGGFDIRPPRHPHFTLAPTAGGRTTLGRLHRSPLASVDRTRRHGLAVTTAARSVVDAAELLSAVELAGVLDEGVGRRLVTVAAVEDAARRAERAPGRIGLGQLRLALQPWTDAIRPESPAEAAAIRRIVEFGLPAPVTQHEVRAPDGTFVARLDMAWIEERVGREYDSARHHGPSRTEADELRVRRLEALGWSIGSVQRQHLRPGETTWLQRLARDLGRRGRQAS